MNRKIAIKLIIATLAVLGTLSLSSSANAISVESTSVPSRTYIIGNHMFTREVSQKYPGYITTASIMLAAQSIPGENINDMKVYYKTARGVWVDGLTNLSIDVPDNFEITAKNLGIFCNPSATNISETVCMQDINSSTINSMNTNTDYMLKDSRDGKSYKIAKLADGKVWMKQNLALGGNKELTLTPDDTDISSELVLPVSEQTNWQPDLYGALPWDCDDNTSCETMRIYAEFSSQYGNFYTWYTATANSGKYSMGANVNAEYSICPKGWRLPTGIGGGSKGELTELYEASGSTYQSFVEATEYVLADSSILGTPLLRPDWWSKTTDNAGVNGRKSASTLIGGVFDKETNPPTIISGYSNFRDNPGVIRCVAK